MQMLFLLFKKEITKTFKLNYLKRGNVSQRNKIMASYIAVGVAFVFFLVRWIKLIFEFRSYNWMEEEIVPFLLTPVISVSVFLALIVGFFGGSGLIFFDKNYEAEYSWPVAVEITVVSKMLVPYFVLVLVDIALIGPLITLYGAVRAISIFFVLAAAVELLLLPVVPYLLGIVLGRLVLSLLQKKSSVTIRLGSIILVMMLGAYFFIVFYFSFSGSDGSQIVQQFISFFGSFTNKYFGCYCFRKLQCKCECKCKRKCKRKRELERELELEHVNCGMCGGSNRLSPHPFYLSISMVFFGRLFAGAMFITIFR